MDDPVWWFGAIHIAFYAIAGVVVLITIGLLKLHMMFNVLGKMLSWHVARARWRQRGTHGLTDEEWKHGEPRP